MWYVPEPVFGEERSVHTANVVLDSTCQINDSWDGESKSMYQTFLKDLELPPGLRWFPNVRASSQR